MKENQDVEKRLEELKNAVDALLEEDYELREEFEMLFERSLDDKPMALGRARRLLEIIIVDQYINYNEIKPPYKKKLKPLFNIIEELSKNDEISKTVNSLCHAVRLAGNNVLHYKPDMLQKRIEVPEKYLLETLEKLSEIVESVNTGNTSIYASSLKPEISKIYSVFKDYYISCKNKEIKDITDIEIIEVLFRSIVSGFEPEELDLLEKYSLNCQLERELPETEEKTIRRLRNAGLIRHDGQWLFTPTRSENIYLTETGNFILALMKGKHPEDIAVLVDDVVKSLNVVMENDDIIKILQDIHENKEIAANQKKELRKLRNKNLIAHSEELLANSGRVYLTDLGYFILGKIIKD